MNEPVTISGKVSLYAELDSQAQEAMHEALYKYDVGDEIEVTIQAKEETEANV